MTPFFIGIAAFLSTMLGGVLALRLRDRLHLILGFSAGSVIAVAFFDLIPEALELGEALGAQTMLSITAAGFLFYLALDRLLDLHGHTHEEHAPLARGHVRAGSFSIHSFLDGVGIGLAFQVSPIVGTIVAVAVLMHGFSDGINTVNVILRDGGSRSKALRWLLTDAIAPGLGLATTAFFTLGAEQLGILLALFAGFFLYIGASDLIPESHHAHPTFWTTVMTLLGAAVLYGAIRVAGV